MNRRGVVDLGADAAYASRVLATTPVFRGVDPEELRQVCAALDSDPQWPTPERFGRLASPTSFTVFQHGHPAETLSIVEQGMLEALVTAEAPRREKHVAYFIEGDIFGRAEVTEASNRVASVRTAEECMLLVI